MTPPTTLSNCPKEFQEHPLPYDDCSPPQPDFKKPEYRHRYFSLGHEINIPLYNPVDMSTRVGIYGIFRPHRNFGIGFSSDMDFAEELTFFGRAQGEFWLDRYGINRLQVAPLFGFRYLFNPQNRPLQDSPTATPGVTGMVPTGGLELAFQHTLLDVFSLGTFLRLLYSPTTELTRADNNQTVTVQPHPELLLGLRFGFELAPNH